MKKIGVIQEEVRIIETITCDLCKRVVQGEDGWNDTYTLVRLTTNISSTGGYEIDVDVCPDCFEKRLIPWLELQGVTIERKQSEW